MRKPGSSLEVIPVTQSSQGSERKCLRHYYYSRIVGLKLKIEKPAFKYGNAFHAAMAMYFRGAGIDEVLAFVENTQVPLLPENDQKSYLGLMKGYFKRDEKGKPHGLLCREGSLYFPEVRISVPFITGRTRKAQGVILKGVIDLIVYDHSATDVEGLDGWGYYPCEVDNKTSSRKMDLTLREWSFQLYYYRMLLSTAIYVFKNRKRLSRQSSSLLKGFEVDPPEAITDEIINKLITDSPMMFYNYAIKSQAKKTEPVYDASRYDLIQVPRHDERLETFMSNRIMAHVRRIREAKRTDTWPQDPLSCYDEGSKFPLCEYYDKCVTGDDSKYVVGDPWSELKQSSGEEEGNFFSEK